MVTWIGLCAGEIWRYLDKNEGKAALKDVFAGIEAPKETILMAIGWLGREGYVILEGKFPNPTLKLNNRPPKK